MNDLDQLIEKAEKNNIQEELDYKRDLMEDAKRLEQKYPKSSWNAIIDIVKKEKAMLEKQASQTLDKYPQTPSFGVNVHARDIAIRLMCSKNKEAELEKIGIFNYTLYVAVRRELGNYV